MKSSRKSLVPWNGTYFERRRCVVFIRRCLTEGLHSAKQRAWLRWALSVRGVTMSERRA
jgi:hypothetical protein